MKFIDLSALRVDNQNQFMPILLGIEDHEKTILIFTTKTKPLWHYSLHQCLIFIQISYAALEIPCRLLATKPVLLVASSSSAVEVRGILWFCWHSFLLLCLFLSLPRTPLKEILNKPQCVHTIVIISRISVGTYAECYTTTPHLFTLNSLETGELRKARFIGIMAYATDKEELSEWMQLKHNRMAKKLEDRVDVTRGRDRCQFRGQKQQQWRRNSSKMQIFFFQLGSFSSFSRSKIPFFHLQVSVSLRVNVAAKSNLMQLQFDKLNKGVRHITTVKSTHQVVDNMLWHYESAGVEHKNWNVHLFAVPIYTRVLASRGLWLELYCIHRLKSTLVHVAYWTDGQTRCGYYNCQPLTLKREDDRRWTNNGK